MSESKIKDHYYYITNLTPEAVKNYQQHVLKDHPEKGERYSL